MNWTWQLSFTFIGLLFLAALIWRRPALGVYVLVGAAVAIENFPLGFPDSVTDTIPFFWNLNNSAGLPISATPAEVVMTVTILAAIRSRSQRPVRPPSRLFKPYLAFIGIVLLAEVHGLASGGDYNHSLWELRPQVYAFILFLLVCSLIRERRQVICLAGVFLAAAALKAGIGLIRYFLVLHSQLPYAESILGHEDSYFLDLFVVASVAVVIWLRRRYLVLALLVASPLVTVAMLENRRRAGPLALGVAVLIVVVVGIRYEAAIRKRLVIVSAIAASICIGLVVTHWNTDYGLLGQIVRPFHAITGQVDQRDLLSDIYRINENANIKVTYSTSRLIGTGFGRPMLIVFPLADISQQYPLWQYIPHNSVLWIAMRMGILGMAAFWALIAMIVLEGLRIFKAQIDPLLRATAAVAVAAVVAELIVGYVDVQLEAYRNMIFFGAMVGLIDAISHVRAEVRAPALVSARRSGAPALGNVSPKRVLPVADL